MFQIMMHVIPRACVNTNGNYTEQRTTVKWFKKNAGAIPTPISRWLHKLLQSEVESNKCQSVSGRAGVDEFTLLAQWIYNEWSAFVVSLNSVMLNISLAHIMMSPQSRICISWQDQFKSFKIFNIFCWILSCCAKGKENKTCVSSC